MKKLALFGCAIVALFASSCAANRPEVPADQANKMRLHRIAPSEDINETSRATQGSTLPAPNDSSWKF